jgi:hypothetical protein
VLLDREGSLSVPSTITAMAEFLHLSRHLTAEEMDVEIHRRWPAATSAEIDRAIDIATEITRDEGVDYIANANALDAELRRRRQGGST